MVIACKFDLRLDRTLLLIMFEVLMFFVYYIAETI